MYFLEQNIEIKNQKELIFKMSSISKTKKQNQPNISSSPNSYLSPKKQFPSISLTKHLQDYKPYRTIDNKKMFGDIDKNPNYNLSAQQKSFMMNQKSQMPSIHNANDFSSIQGYLQATQGKIQKVQQKILRSLLTSKREQQWRLYMTKSQLIQKSQQFEQIEEYLLKFISKNIDKPLNTTQYVEQDKTNEQKDQMLNIPSVNRKMNQTFSNSVLQTTKGISKKASQPSLRLLKEKHNTKDTAQNDTGLNKTSINLKGELKSQQLQKMQAKYLQQLNRMTFQRGLIEKKMQMYQSRIQYLENRLRQEDIPIDSVTSRDEFGVETKHVGRKHSPAQQILMSNIITQNKYKSQAEVKKIQNQTLIKELNVIKQFSFQVKIENERLLKQLDLLQKQCNQCRQYKKYKQLWLMQCEQTIGWKSMWKERKDQTLRLNNKLKILKQKNKQLLHSFNFSMIVHPDQEQDKMQLENIIKGFQDWLKVMSIPRVNSSAVDTKALLEQMTLKQKQYMPDPDNLNFKLLKPNFFIFFQAYQKTIMMEKNILNTRPLEPAFYVKIRAILDSFYNHFNSYGHYKYWTSFPQFVIGFLEKYQISQITLKMQPRKKPMSSEQKLTFLMNLFNKKISNTWQCDMFRSFILEEYTLDEIYFFLDCRNDMNGGAALTHGFGTIDPVSYVKLSKALATTQRKLSPYQNYIIERVKSIIKSRKTQKYGEMFIDRHFVLKLLLQVYALQKTKSQKVFEASFKTRNSKKSIVSYSDYFNFMTKNFQFLTTVDVCQLYRETYALTSGKITHKAVHYVCQSRGLFIPLIWSKRLNMNVLQKSLNSDMIMLDLQNNARKMDGHLSQFGVQDVGRLQNELNYFLRQLDWYRNNRQVFYFKLQEIKMRIQKGNCLLNWQSSTYSPNELLSSQEIREGILQIHNLIHQSDNSVKLLTNKKQEKQKAMKKIIHNFKIRIQQSMREFKRVDQDQLRKLKEQMAIEIKLREMRQRQQQTEENQESDTADNNAIGDELPSVKQILSGRVSVQKPKIEHNLHEKDEIVEENNEDSQKQQLSDKKSNQSTKLPQIRNSRG